MHLSLIGCKPVLRPTAASNAAISQKKVANFVENQTKVYTGQGPETTICLAGRDAGASWIQSFVSVEICSSLDEWQVELVTTTRDGLACHHYRITVGLIY